MFNVAIIRLKDLVKYTIYMLLIIMVLVFMSKYFKEKNLSKLNLGQKVSKKVEQYIKNSVNLEIPGIYQAQIEYDEETDEKERKKEDFIDAILNLELGFLKLDDSFEVKNQEIDKIQLKEKTETDIEKEEEKDDEKIELAKDNEKTEITTKNPIVDSYNLKYKSVKIKNETIYDLTDEDLNFDNLKIDKSNILIFHTHTCESYTQSKKYSYTQTGNFRTTNLKYTVARVGDELERYLKKYNINVIHNKTYHDYPAYTGSYARSLATVSKLLESKKCDIIIDLHRDAIGKDSSYAPTVEIGNDECAQIMFVIGSNGGGLKHPNWKQNLKFAVKFQELANKKYPGLFKPIILRNSRYNQHLGKAACIIEVGATGNTLEQCLKSMKYLSKIMDEI